MKTSPIIGITHDRFPDISIIEQNYIRAVEAAGGIPKVLPVTTDAADIETATKECDGFVFIGGPDLNAQRYGRENHPSMTLLPPELEEHYMVLGKHVLLHTTKPVLGICLGYQLINTIFGGTLITDIPSFVPKAFWHSRPIEDKTLETMHEVVFTPDSPLNNIIGDTWLCCNSSHHQAIDTLAPGLIPAGYARDGILEAFYNADFNSRFILGVQWHPERLFDKVYGHLKLFKSLINHAAEM